MLAPAVIAGKQIGKSFQSPVTDADDPLVAMPRAAIGGASRLAFRAGSVGCATRPRRYVNRKLLHVIGTIVDCAYEIG